MNAIVTKHKLDFEVTEWSRHPSILLFRVGTVEGQWFPTENAYCILSFLNNSPGNGHLEYVFQWFEFSCKRDGKALIVLECMNQRFKKHLLEKRGFVPMMNDDVIKEFVSPTTLKQVK
jgi:hypothetical protein